MRGLGVRFNPSGGQAYRVDGRFVFWGGRRPGAVPKQGAWWRASTIPGLQGRCRTSPSAARDRPTDLGWSGRRGSRAAWGTDGPKFEPTRFVLACGGWNSAPNGAPLSGLGPRQVRGTRFSNGDGLSMALGRRAGGGQPGPAATPSAGTGQPGVQRPGGRRQLPVKHSILWNHDQCRG